MPARLEDLVALPGIGRKTANVVLGNAFGVPGLTVDTHFGRLVRRFGWTELEDPVKVEHAVAALLPKADWTMFSHRVIFHGRRVCHARKPACGACGIARAVPVVRRRADRPGASPGRWSRGRQADPVAGAVVSGARRAPAPVAVVGAARRRPCCSPPPSLLRDEPADRRAAPRRPTCRRCATAAALEPCPRGPRPGAARPRPALPRRRPRRRAARARARPADARQRLGVVVRPVRRRGAGAAWPSTSRPAGRVGVVGVLHHDDVASRGLAFSRDFGMRYPSVVDDDGEVLRAFPPGPPVTLFLDAEGRVVHTRSGAFRDLAEIEALVAEHLGVRL